MQSYFSWVYVISLMDRASPGLGSDHGGRDFKEHPAVTICHDSVSRPGMNCLTQVCGATIR